MGIEVAGHMPDGRPIERIALSDGPLSAHILTYGAIVQDIRFAPFKHSLILGFEDVASYLSDGAYIGAVVGRVANRIAGGVLEIGGRVHALDRNEGENTLHGGAKGTSRQLWQVRDHGADHVTLGLILPDGHMGFSGEIDLRVQYTVAGNTFGINFEASAAAMTVCNLAPHLYFNLDGQGDARDHVLCVEADRYLPVTPDCIPTGEQRAVAGTPWDFRIARTLREGGAAYDHNFCLADSRRALSPALILTAPRSGLSMALQTTEPGVQIYDGAGLDVPYSGIALEPQGWPDAPNHRNFPSIMLARGEMLKQSSRLVFRAPAHSL